MTVQDVTGAVNLRKRPGGNVRKSIVQAASLIPASGWYIAFFFLPLAWMLRVSFAVLSNFHLKYVWSLSAYRALFHDPLVGELLSRSLLLAAAVTGGTLIIGFPAAWILARQPPGRRNVILVLMIVPWWSSYIVRVFAWEMSFGRTGILNQFLIWIGVTHGAVGFLNYGWFGVWVAELNLYLPLMIVPLYLSLERLDRDLIRAALSLGAGPVRVFRKIVLPLTAPGMIVGTIFVFMPMTGEFVAPNLVGGPAQELYGNQIQNQFGVTYNWPYGCTLAVVLLAVLVGFLILLRVAGSYAIRNLREA
jgi:spermidine/putrescine transport system permease protein